MMRPCSRMNTNATRGQAATVARPDDWYETPKETGMGTPDFRFVLDGVRPGMPQSTVYRIMVANLVAWKRDTKERMES